MAACSNGSQDAKKLIRTTTSGRVQGYIQDSVAVFKGVPYASAERFMPAHEHEKWDTVMQCREYGDIAPQPPLMQNTEFAPTDTVATMSDDCLNLNIWTSMRNRDTERPVMVWLHGGGFDYGNSHHHYSFDGTKLARTDNVVVVTLNHRLNVLGFLDLSAYGPEYAGSGNLGMTDIVAALKWIKNNIAAFGGNPDNVTLFGHGSGGVKVLTIMAMPSAKGLYHKAIVQSGVLEGFNQPRESAQRVAALTLEEAGTDTPQQLAGLPFDSLWNASSRAIKRVKTEFGRETGLHSIKLAPVVDGNVLPKPVITDSSINVDLQIPVILGSTFAETTTRHYLDNPELGMKSDVHRLSPEEVEKKIKEKYGKQAEDVKLAFMTAYPDKALCEVLVIDSTVRSNVLRMAHLLAKRGDAPVYVYLFNWVSPLYNGYAMSFRSSELPFVFNNHELAEFSRAGGNEARRLARIISRCWTSFARSGNPNNSITPFWRRINLGEGHTMIFDRDVRLEAYPDLPLMQILEYENVNDIHLN